MKRRIYWGLVILIILLIGASVFLLTRTTDTKPKNVYIDVDPSEPGNQSSKKLSETYKFTKWWEENKANLVTNDTEQAEGNIPDGQKVDKFPDFHSLTPEQQQWIFDQFYVQRGLKPPPRGYQYRWKDINVPLLDENGNPVLHKIGEPYVEIEMGIGFAPTREEFEKYNQLQAERDLAEVSLNSSSEVDRLDAEIKALEAAVQRMRPLSVMSTSIGDEAASKAARVRREKYNAALREHGLEHLISPWK